MAYPNLKEKYLHEALFHPTDYIDYKKWDKEKFPKKYIITYQTKAKNYFIRKYKPKKYKLYSLLDIHVHKNMGFVKMTGIGAPNAVSVVEELIALGGREFLNIGTAGGLHHEGTFLCVKALRDEGTSHHYAKPEKFSHPNKELTKKLEESMKNEKIEFFRGTTWTIDAPYRETKAEIEKYAKEGISTVEMEASALFAVAEYRKVKIASAFVVSDLLDNEWEANFHRFDIVKAQNKLIDAAVNCFMEK